MFARSVLRTTGPTCKTCGWTGKGLRQSTTNSSISAFRLSFSESRTLRRHSLCRFYNNLKILLATFLYKRRGYFYANTEILSRFRAKGIVVTQPICKIGASKQTTLANTKAKQWKSNSSYTFSALSATKLNPTATRRLTKQTRRLARLEASARTVAST